MCEDLQGEIIASSFAYNFVCSITSQLERGRMLSEKQDAILCQLFNRYILQDINREREAELAELRSSYTDDSGYERDIYDS